MYEFWGTYSDHITVYNEQKKEQKMSWRQDIMVLPKLSQDANAA